MGVYAFAGGETTLAQKCLLRARLLVLTVHGEDHPYIATLDVSLQYLGGLPNHKKGFSGHHYKHYFLTILFVCLFVLQNCLGLALAGDQSGQYLRNALRLNTSFFGPTNVHTALR